MSQIAALNHQLNQLSNAQKSLLSKRFFKTAAGTYAEGEQFLGIAVPVLRTLIKQYQALTLNDLTVLLNSSFNEKRLFALFILIYQYNQAQKKQNRANQEKIFQFFMAHRHRVNNWNLVDSSAPYIVGAHLWKRDCSLLTTLAASDHLWDKRIAIVATWFFIRQGDFEWTIKLATLLLNDPHDLMHKAVGWMLREMGKKNELALVDFLNKHAAYMPRTMLRAAVEKFPPNIRAVYLKKHI